MNEAALRMEEISQNAVASTPAQDPNTAMNQHIADGNTEEAFKVALGEQDVELVASLCKRVDCGILNARPPVLSQPILCSLVQQLGAILSHVPSPDLTLFQDLTWKLSRI